MFHKKLFGQRYIGVCVVRENEAVLTQQSAVAVRTVVDEHLITTLVCILCDNLQIVCTLIILLLEGRQIFYPQLEIIERILRKLWYIANLLIDDDGLPSDLKTKAVIYKKCIILKKHFIGTFVPWRLSSG